MAHGRLPTTRFLPAPTSPSTGGTLMSDDGFALEVALVAVLILMAMAGRRIARVRIERVRTPQPA